MKELSGIERKEEKRKMNVCGSEKGKNNRKNGTRSLSGYG